MFPSYQSPLGSDLYFIEKANNLLAKTDVRFSNSRLTSISFHKGGRRNLPARGIEDFDERATRQLVFRGFMNLSAPHIFSALANVLAWPARPIRGAISVAGRTPSIDLGDGCSQSVVTNPDAWCLNAIR